MAQSWVTVKLRDINDNKPIFEKANIEALVRENARVGKTLERFRATDPDQGGKSQVRYEIDRSSGNYEVLHYKILERALRALASSSGGAA